MIQVNSPSTLWSVNICSVLFPNKPSSISTGARELNIYSYFSTQYVFFCVCVCGGVCVCVCVEVGNSAKVQTVTFAILSH